MVSERFLIDLNDYCKNRSCLWRYFIMNLTLFFKFCKFSEKKKSNISFYCKILFRSVIFYPFYHMICSWIVFWKRVRRKFCVCLNFRVQIYFISLKSISDLFSLTKNPFRSVFLSLEFSSDLLSLSSSFLSCWRLNGGL